MKTSNTFGMVRTKLKDGKLVPKAHQGIDYHAPVGTPILAVKTGTVVDINENNGKYGKTITLEFVNEDGNKSWAFYSHLSEINVDLNQSVNEGDEMGKTGITGNAKNFTGEDQHLHFEYRTKSKRAGEGLAGREDPNKIVDTKFQIDPNNSQKVIQVQSTEPQNNNQQPKNDTEKQ
jgi:murein DD-endopeptidase MepM/ murein hydrolase activator NlpD